MKNIVVGFVLFLSFLVISPAPIAAAVGSGPCKTLSPQTIAIFPAWYDGLLKDNKGTILSPGDPCLGKDTGEQFGKWLTIIAMNIVKMILYVVGYASLIFIIWGGFKYMTQGDNSSGTVAARKTIQNAIIGLVLSIMSVSIVTFIAGSIQ
ncbi:hypothetical protein KC953_01260 [Candidatus Saccharibacteria bacterium]|nr:hypothetical protein [Candidatus Saccharibacteria bacterium]